MDRCSCFVLNGQIAMMEDGEREGEADDGWRKKQKKRKVVKLVSKPLIDELNLK